MDKKLKIWEVGINYKEFWENWIETIFILHWWWWKSDSWVEVSNLLSEVWYKVIVPDLPWFWKTILDKTYSLDDYAILMEQFINTFWLNDCILWWHSNWWAISIKISLRNNVNISRLILNNSAWIRNDQKRSLKRLILSNIIKPFKFIVNVPGWKKLRNIFYRAIGSHDYLNAEKNIHLKETYKNMISSDLSEDIKDITNHTLLIRWEKDTYTPLSDGNFMRNDIKKSKIITLDWEKHWIHLHSPKKLVDTFLDNI